MVNILHENTISSTAEEPTNGSSALANLVLGNRMLKITRCFGVTQHKCFGRLNLTIENPDESGNTYIQGFI